MFIFFKLSEQQVKKVEEWANSKTGHECTLKPNEYSRKYCGAVGGHLTYCVTPTSIGSIIIVKCSCGQELDISDI